MRSILIPIFILLALPVVPAQNTNAPNAGQLPKAPPLLSEALCGKGTYLVSLGGTSIGRETFDVQCAETGFVAKAKTNFKIAATIIDIESELELDKKAIPTKFTSRGTMATTSVDQTIIFRNGKATITTSDGSQDMLYQDGASYVMANLSYVLAFVAARYDNALGGEQSIPLFPNAAAILERTARDEVRPLGSAVGPRTTLFDRYTMKLGPATLVLWSDMQGRIAAMSMPVQNFVAVRDEYASFVAPLHAALAPFIKTLKPDYSVPNSAPFTAEEVRIKVKNYILAGTLLLPKGGTQPYPVVVTSTGSGQQTRDEPISLPNLKDYKPFRQIAEHLATHGIAVLRVDDRGVGDSTGIDTLDRATTFDFADDVRAQVAYLRTRPDIDPKRIAIVGHSEGGIIAPMVAASDPKIAAIVLLAGTAKRGEDVLLYQMNRPLELNAAMTDEEKSKGRAANQSILRTVIEGGDISKLPQIFHFQWTKVFLTYDPLPTIRKVRQPILIVQGELDRQVTADQADMLAKAAMDAGNKDVMVRVFPKLNHLFLPSKEGDESEYSSLEVTTLSDDVLRAIGDWLQFKLQRSEPGPKR
jgi:dienelactone hydrolase